MKKIAIISALLALVAIPVIMYITTSNKEITLVSKMEAQKSNVESCFDKMWKVIQQKSGVTSEYKNAFKEIYPELIEGRYNNARGGSLMSWVTENNPDFDVRLYVDLMRSIEAERAGFFMEQKKMIDLINQHRIIRKTFPGNLFIGNRPDFKYEVVSSTKAKEIMGTAIDDNIELF